MNKFSKIAVFTFLAVCIAGFAGVKTTAAETRTIEKGVYVGSVDVGGMTEEEAHQAIDDYVESLMDTSFTLKGETGSITMSAKDMKVTADVDASVQEALAVGHAGNLINRYKCMQDLKKEKLVLDMQLSIDKQAAAQKLYESADSLSVGAVDNTLTRENGKFKFVPGKEGVEVDIINSVYAINDFLAKGWDGTDNEIDLVTKTAEPRGSEEELAQVKDLLGSYSTDFSSSSAGRAKNVTTGCSKVDGTILYPGDEFELCKTVSPFTQENGYELAGMYQNGETVEAFGGGICQVATTLYNAVIRAELEITMRYNHSMEVHYVQPSMDAAIAGNYKDLRFKNNLDTPVYLEGYCSGGVIHFNVYGKETRPSNREISFESEVLSTVDPDVKFTLDSSLPLGQYSVTQSGNKGCTAQLWKVVTVDGKQQSRDIFNKSSYKGTARMITIGTKNATEESLAVLKSAVATKNEAKVRAAASALVSKDDEKKDKDDPDANEKKDPDDDKKDESGNKKEDKKKDNVKTDDKKEEDSSKENEIPVNKSE